MKTKKIGTKLLLLRCSFLLFLIGILGFSSCDKDDDDIQPEYGVPMSLIADDTVEE
jgi:hypothetical protein